MQFLIFGALSMASLMVLHANAVDVDNNEINVRGLDLRPVVWGVSGRDCGINECSVMGMQRFSEPSCSPLRTEGQDCIVGAEADNKTLDFPNKVLLCSEVYTLMCPCTKGLVCKAAKCVKSNRLNPLKTTPKRRIL